MSNFRATQEDYRLYNAGDKISEIMHYSLADGHDVHVTARYSVEAPAKEFFTVPQVLFVREMQIRVDFLETLLRADRYGERGVILVNANWKSGKDPDADEVEPVAQNEKEAVLKGARHWKKYLLKVAQQFIDQCNAIRAAGGVPVAAQGFIVRALKECGMTDPATQVLVASQQNKSEIDTLKEEMAELRKLLGGKGKAKSESSPTA